MSKRTVIRKALWCTRMAIRVLGALHARCWELHGERVVLKGFQGSPTRAVQQWCIATRRSWWIVVDVRRFDGPCSGAAAHNYACQMIPPDQWIRGTYPRIQPTKWEDYL